MSMDYVQRWHIRIAVCTAPVLEEILHVWCQVVFMLCAGTEAATEGAAGIHPPRAVQQAGTRIQSSGRHRSPFHLWSGDLRTRPPNTSPCPPLRTRTLLHPQWIGHCLLRWSPLCSRGWRCCRLPTHFRSVVPFDLATIDSCHPPPDLASLPRTVSPLPFLVIAALLSITVRIGQW